MIVGVTATSCQLLPLQISLLLSFSSISWLFHSYGLKNCGTGRVNCNDPTVWLVDASIHNVNCVQQSILLLNCSSSALFSVMLVGTVSIILNGTLLNPPFTSRGSVTNKSERVFSTTPTSLVVNVSLTHCLRLVDLYTAYPR